MVEDIVDVQVDAVVVGRVQENPTA